MANVIEINDFGLFFETMKTAAKLVDAAKLIVSPTLRLLKTRML